MSQANEKTNAIEPPFRTQRMRLAAHVQRTLEREGRYEPAAIAALQNVPREKFVPAGLVDSAYNDHPLPIGCDQTISQPTVVAWMIGALELQPDSRVLEIGTGCGYAAAILAEIAGEVYTVERHEPLARQAKQRLDQLGYESVHIRRGDGREGWAEHAPFDAIVAAAAGDEAPTPLLRQLRIGGRLVIPIADDEGVQRMFVIQRTTNDEFHTQDLGEVRFVPLAAGIPE